MVITDMLYINTCLAYIAAGIVHNNPTAKIPVKLNNTDIIRANAR